MPTAAAAAAATADAEVSVAAIGICFGLHVIVFMLIDGLAVAVSVRVANELGELLAGCRCVCVVCSLCSMCMHAVL
jgi:Na+-driven multidrug efflux pump